MSSLHYDPIAPDDASFMMRLPVGGAARLRRSCQIICEEDVVPIVDRLRQSLDILFRAALTFGLMTAVAAMILANLPE